MGFLKKLWNSQFAPSEYILSKMQKSADAAKRKQKEKEKTKSKKKNNNNNNNKKTK